MRVPLAALLMLAVALAGCTSPPPEPPGPRVDTSLQPMAEQVFTARQAAEAAIPFIRQQYPGAVLAAMEGLESNSTHPIVQGKLFLAGFLRDPSVGDGLLSGWGAQFNTTRGPVRVAALANGSLTLQVGKGGGATHSGDLVRWGVDSPQAIAVAMADGEFRDFVLANGSYVDMSLVPPDPAYRNDPVRRVLAEDPFWNIQAFHPGASEDGSLRVIVNARSGERMYADPFGTIRDDRYGHEHVSLAIFIGGGRVRFDDPAYDQSRISGKVHLNVSEPDGGTIWHLEALFHLGEANLTLERILKQYGIHFGDRLLILDRHAHNGTTWPDEGPDGWHVWVSNVTGGVRNPFTEVERDHTKYVPRDLDKVLLTYGALSPEELARQQAALPEPPRP